jgi:hypothetical protein
MPYKIVVARYQENIDWLDPIKKDCIFINKGEALGLENEILLPNLGRESDSYLWYIINNYDQLPDVVAFTQGDISDHSYIFEPDFHECLIEAISQAGLQGKSDIFHTHSIDDIHVNPQWNYSKTDNTYFLPDNYKNNIPVKFGEWFCKHVNTVYPDPIHVYWAAIFAVKKEYILKRPREYYETLIQEVNHHVNPIEGHFIERSWYYIFE